MTRDRFRTGAGTAVAFFLGACSGSSAQPGDAHPLASERVVPGQEGPARPSAAAYPAPRPLTAALSEQIWAGLFGSYRRAAEQELTPAEHELVLVELERAGVPRDVVSFVGSNVLVEDVIYGGEPWFAALHAQSSGSFETDVEKGKVLAQVVTQVIGAHDTTLVQPSDVVGAPTLYASQPIDDQFLFDRPEVDPSFEHLLVLADDVPDAIFAAFEASVAEIGNASGADCLGSAFLEVVRRSDFDARFADRQLVPPRVIEVSYSAEACGGRSLGCTQFPHAEDVVLASATADGEPGSVQSRIVFGSFIGINAAAVTPESAELSTLTHELLHALGLAHPVVETFANGAVAAKLVVPGTESADSAFPSIMAFRSTADRTFNLSPDDIDTIRTLYSSAPGCEYQSAPLLIQPTDDPPGSDAGALTGAGSFPSADAGAPDAG